MFKEGHPSISTPVRNFIERRLCLGNRQATPGLAPFYVDDLILVTDASLKGILEAIARSVLSEANSRTADDKSSPWVPAIEYIGWAFQKRQPLRMGRQVIM